MATTIWRIFLATVWIGAWYAAPLARAEPGAGSPPSAMADKHRHHHVDRSGRKQRGKASYYSRRFDGKKMADGKRLNPNADVAASKTLPLGTEARVKNLETGKSTTVEIEDRGPYVKGRIIDLTPKAAEKLDMKKDGVAPVEVTPLQLPPPTQEEQSGKSK